MSDCRDRTPLTHVTTGSSALGETKEQELTPFSTDDEVCVVFKQRFGSLRKLAGQHPDDAFERETARYDAQGPKRVQWRECLFEIVRNETVEDAPITTRLRQAIAIQRTRCILLPNAIRQIESESKDVEQRELKTLRVRYLESEKRRSHTLLDPNKNYGADHFARALLLGRIDIAQQIFMRADKTLRRRLIAKYLQNTVLTDSSS